MHNKKAQAAAGERQPRYYAAAMHLHSTFEGTASIAGHCSEAADVGVDVVWLTDHDSRIIREQEQLERVVMEPAETASTTDNPVLPLLINETNCSDGAVQIRPGASPGGRNSLHLNGEDCRVRLGVTGKKERRSLLSQVEIGLQVKPEGPFRLGIVLAQHPPDLEYQVLEYSWGLADSTLTLQPGRWNDLVLTVSQDAAAAGVSQDNTVCWFDLCAQGPVSVGDFWLEHKPPADVWRAQRELGEQVGSRYGVTVHTATEVSATGHHMCAFGPMPGMIDYSGKPSVEDGARILTERGVVYSLNHPFSKWKREESDEQRRQELIAERVDDYLEANCYGAHLIEVGFPDRHGFQLPHYLALYDRLLLAGARIAATGVSDAHSATGGWRGGNNYANWIWAASPAEADLLAGLRRGNILVGDPVLFKGTLSLTTNQGGAPGETVQASASQVRLVYQDLDPAWHLVWVVDGERVAQAPLGAAAGEKTLTVSGARFVRAEIWAGERCAVFTNPIFFAPA